MTKLYSSANLVTVLHKDGGRETKRIAAISALFIALIVTGCASKDTAKKEVEKWTGGKEIFQFDSTSSQSFHLVCVGKKLRFVKTNRFLDLKMEKIFTIDTNQAECVNK